MEEFRNCVPDELKVYLNERRLVTSYEMVATADEYVITHKKERRKGDLMGQVGTKSGLNPHREIRRDNRGIKGTPPSYNERLLMQKENRRMVCYHCGKPGHMASHIVGYGKITPTEAKTCDILKYPTPKNIRGFRRFLGMAGYYQKFCKDFSERTAPLIDLIKKGNRFRWIDEYQTFEDVK